MKKLILLIVASVLAGHGIAFVGCDDSGETDADGDADSDGDGDGDGDGDVPSCSETCREKANECGAPQDQAAAACATLCSGSVTASQVTCLAGTPCEELMAAFTGGSVCGIGTETDGDADGDADGDGDSGPECLELGETGCSTLGGVAPCCDDLTCFSNSDGSQICCVSQGGPCDSDGDCCGHVDNDLYNCSVDGECTLGF